MNLEFVYKAFGKLVTAYYCVKLGSLLAVYFVTHPFTKLAKDRPVPPKCLTESKHGEHNYANVNGIKLHYVEKGDRSKPLMVFVHGFPEFWYSWRHQLQEFSKDYWCVAIDKRGYGDSEKPKDQGDYKLDTVVKDVKELVTHLGRERFTMIGHDWGAVITYRFVDVYGSMLDNFVVMSGPSGDIWAKLVFTEWWQFRHAWYVFFFQNWCLPEISLKMKDLNVFKAMVCGGKPGVETVTMEDIEAYKYTYGKPGALTPPLNYYRANFLKQYKSPEKITARGLFILGEHDDYISKGCVEPTKKKYEGLEVVILKDARHFIQQEQPQEVNELIREFLKKK